LKIIHDLGAKLVCFLKFEVGFFFFVGGLIFMETLEPLDILIKLVS